MKEFILCAAIWLNDHIEHKQQPINITEGFVICGRRHNNCYQTVSDVSGLSINDTLKQMMATMTDDDHRKHQGFITSLDRYVDRFEGYKIAKQNNQIQFGKKATENNDKSILISENLY